MSIKAGYYLRCRHISLEQQDQLKETFIASTGWKSKCLALFMREKIQIRNNFFASA